jgi:hypothetical protein
MFTLRQSTSGPSEETKETACKAQHQLHKRRARAQPHVRR